MIDEGTARADLVSTDQSADQRGRCNRHAKRLWSLWQALLLDIASGFTTAGRRRFVEWVTGLALNVEEHTITQSLVGLDRVADWKAGFSSRWLQGFAWLLLRSCAGRNPDSATRNPAFRLCTPSVCCLGADRRETMRSGLTSPAGIAPA